MKDEGQIDGTSLIFHPQRLNEWLETGDAYPLNVEMGITNICNHSCTFCGLDWVPRTRQSLEQDILKETFPDMAEHGVKSITFSAESEPTVHKHFADIVSYAKESGLDVALATNGQLYNQSRMEQTLPHLTWMRFSLDAATPETYEKVHRTNPRNFQTVLDNIGRAVEFKREHNLPVTIGTQMVMVRDNFNEVEELARITGELGVDNFQVKPYAPHPCSSLPDISVDLSRLDTALKERLSTYDHVLFRANAVKHNANKTYDRCHSLPFYTLIDARGNVMPCNMFYAESESIYGNLNDTGGSFSEIWDSDRRKEIMERIGSMELDNCRTACVPAAKNEFLHRLKHPHGHDNFV